MTATIVTTPTARGKTDATFTSSVPDQAGVKEQMKMYRHEPTFSKITSITSSVRAKNRDLSASNQKSSNGQMLGKLQLRF